MYVSVEGMHHFILACLLLVFLKKNEAWNTLKV